jgi:hypothetical protein
VFSGGLTSKFGLSGQFPDNPFLLIVKSISPDLGYSLVLNTDAGKPALLNKLASAISRQQ